MNYIDKKLEELSEKYNWDEIFGKNSKSEKSVKSFLKQALEEQERELFKYKKGDVKRIIDVNSGKEFVWRIIEVNKLQTINEKLK